MLHSVCNFTSSTKGWFLYFTTLLDRKAYVVLSFYVPSDFIDTGNMDDEGMEKRLPLCFYFICIKGFTSKSESPVWLITFLSVLTKTNKKKKYIRIFQIL
jgi:hypothetical protein